MNFPPGVKLHLELFYKAESIRFLTVSKYNVDNNDVQSKYALCKYSVLLVIQPIYLNCPVLQLILSLPRTVVVGARSLCSPLLLLEKRGAWERRTSSPTTSTGSGESLVCAPITTCLYVLTPYYTRQKRVGVGRWLTK